MKTLFIDSSRRSLSVALVSNDTLLFVSNVDSYSKHSNFLMNEIVNILNKTGNKIYDIDNILVLNGPGSFTGVRVGVTISKTIAWTLSKKLYELTTLKALSLHDDNDVVISVIYDKDTTSYVGIYDEEDVEDYIDLDNIKQFNGKNITIVSFDDNNFVKLLNNALSKNNNVKIKIIDDYDYIKVVNYALSTKSINPHAAEPVYMKKIDAEKKSDK